MCGSALDGRPDSVNEILIFEGAEADYTESLRWYAERSRQAAEGFEAEFARALKGISANPGRFPMCDDRHRFYLLKRYPFQIIYRPISDEKLLIVAVAHTSRRPGYWMDR
jgi:plasmid stabilization system protein ParE